MTHLASRPARPRSPRTIPQYPRAIAAGAVMVALSGACTPQQSSPQPTAPSSGAPVTVVPAEPPNEPMVLAGEEGPAHIATAGMHFPEDDAPLDENIGCRGDCPAPWVMAINRKDRNQIEARIRYCDKAARDQGERNAGQLSVTASIDAKGHAQDVKLTPTGSVSDNVSSCVRELVQSAQFASERDHARQSYASANVGEQPE